MKRVCLIGDSIRLGYEPTVRKELAGVAEIIAPAENGQHTVNLLRHFHDWIQESKPDLIHMAAGMWDTRRVVRGVPGNVVPLEHYRQNLSRLLEYAKNYTSARIIWATITPVNLAANFNFHEGTTKPDRAEGEIERYNAVAVELAKQQGVEVNDLHEFVMQEGKDQLLGPDGVHLTEDGYAQLGKVVAQVIRDGLAALGERHVQDGISCLQQQLNGLQLLVP